MIHKQQRQFYIQLFLEGQFIPKIQALAEMSDICPVCQCAFNEHPRNHHVTDDQISMATVCVGCGAGIVVKPIEEFGSLEYVPCQDCFRDMSDSDFPNRNMYSFQA